jgi:hypothetical protein
LSVADGQIGNAATFNAAFASKNTDNTLTGVLELDNGSSGATVANTQQAINDNIADIASLDGRVTQNESDIATLQGEISTISTGFVFEAAQDVEEASTIALNASNRFQAVPVSGDGGAVTAANAPFTPNPPDGTVLLLIGGANAVTVPYADTDGGCLLNGDWTGTTGMTLQLIYSSSASRYYEITRNQ